MYWSDWAPFNTENVDSVPERSGVYALGSHETIYIGQSDNLRERLKEHLTSNDPCIQQTKSFSYFETLFPGAEEEKQLTAFQYEHGRLPQCNVQSK